MTERSRAWRRHQQYRRPSHQPFPAAWQPGWRPPKRWGALFHRGLKVTRARQLGFTHPRRWDEWRQAYGRT